nr:unnamed protein product [Callosobruchus analis]
MDELENQDDDSQRPSVKELLPNYENVPNDAPRSRSGVYSPTIVNTALVDQCPRYIEPIVKVQEPGAYSQYLQHNARFVEPYREYYDGGLVNAGGKYYEHNLSTKLAKLRVLENVKQSQMEAGPSTNHDNADRDTNNDSGYSTKVYGSSKGNSPSLSGQIDGGECLGASSLV